MTTAPEQPYRRYMPVRLDTEYLAHKLSERWHEKNPKGWQGSSASQKAGFLDTFRDFTRCLEAALATGSPAIFTDYVCWMKVFAAHRRFPPDFITAFLTGAEEVLRKELHPDYRDDALEMLRKSRSALKKAPDTIPSYITEQNPMASRTREYLDSLLEGNSTKAEEVIIAAVRSGVLLRDIYLHIIQPALQETGRLWQMQEIPVGQEHFVSAATMAVMARLHDHVRAAAGAAGRRHATVIITAAAGDLHDIGTRILADFFDMDGWETYLTGANTPAESIIAAAREKKAGLIAISCTMPFHISSVEYLIRSLRADPATKKIAVLVGGRPFVIAPGLWQKVGADAFAPDAAEAVAAADRLMAKNGNGSGTTDPAGP